MEVESSYEGWMDLGAPDEMLCKICMEPVTTNVCVDCLKKGIQKLVEKHRSEFSSGLEDFHSDLVESFLTFQNGGVCIKCRKTMSVSVCPHCYVNDVICWAKKLDGQMARAIEKFFRSYVFDTYSVKNFTSAI